MRADPSGEVSLLAGDVSLLVGVCRRRREALAGLFERHGAALLDLAAEVCGAEEADAVVHDVFLRLWEHPEEVSAECGSLRAHLVAVTHAGAVERVRRRPEGRRPRVQNHRSLAILPVGQHRAISLVYFGGCTLQEAASALGCSEVHVCRQIADGLAHLRLVAEEAQEAGAEEAGSEAVH